jgi:hypothetical protein
MPRTKTVLGRARRSLAFCASIETPTSGDVAIIADPERLLRDSAEQVRNRR